MGATPTPRGWNYYCCFLMALALMVMSCSAEQHVVGDDRGWDPLSDLPGWVSRKIFRVGDNIWFAYASAQQSVLELKSQEEFERCDMSNPIKLFNGGLDAVPLIEEGSRYFTSGRQEDCQRGMKVHINVVLKSDGMDKDVDAHHFSSLTTSVIDKISFDVVSWMKEEARVEVVAKAPTSGTYELFNSLRYSFSMNLTLYFCCLVTTMLYAMA